MDVCVVGAGRTGTRLLRELLNLHSSLYLVGETHWVPTMGDVLGLGRCPVEQFWDVVDRTSHVDGVPTLRPMLAEAAMTRAELEIAVHARVGAVTDVRGFNQALYAALAAVVGKSMTGDRTADYGAYMGRLQQLWPELRFVHVLRDGRDAALSMYHHPGFRRMVALKTDNWVRLSFDGRYRRPGGSSDRLIDYARLWERRVQRILDEARQLSPDSYRVVRYEETVRDPEPTLRGLAEFLNIRSDGPWVERAKCIIRHERFRPGIHPALRKWLTEAMGETLYLTGYS